MDELDIDETAFYGNYITFTMYSVTDWKGPWQKSECSYDTAYVEDGISTCVNGYEV